MDDGYALIAWGLIFFGLIELVARTRLQRIRNTFASTEGRKRLQTRWDT